jgi:hypothetical protein
MTCDAAHDHTSADGSFAAQMTLDALDAPLFGKAASYEVDSQSSSAHDGITFSDVQELPKASSPRFTPKEKIKIRMRPLGKSIFIFNLTVA